MPSSMPSTSEGKKRMYRYLEDFEEEDMNCPTKAKQALLIAKRQVASQRRKVDQLRTSNTRCKKKVSSMATLLSELKEKTNLTDEVCQVLEASLPGPSKELVKRALSAQEKGQNSPELRSFALTLQFYSTKAYNYVRETFDFALPHKSTLRKWYKSVDGSAGFTSGALTALKAKVAEASQKGEKVYCAMVVDEVAIRQHLEWDGQKLSGYVDFGTVLDSDQLPVAKEHVLDVLTINMVVVGTGLSLHYKQKGEEVVKERQCSMFPAMLPQLALKVGLNVRCAQRQIKSSTSTYILRNPP